MRTTTKTKRRESKRRYPEQSCAHCGMSFIPTDSRQKYCSKQHGIDYRNDDRKRKNQNRFIIEKSLRHCDNQLEKALRRLEQLKKDTISLESLELLGVDITLATQQMLYEKNKMIRWFHFYGLELVDAVSERFKIHKRTKIR
jgi:hypothetical protein